MNNLRNLFLLRPDVIFLNHGSFGACPKPVLETYQNWQVELEREPVEFMARRFADLMFEARHTLGEYLKAGGDNLVFVTNATTGLNIVARSLPLEPGDEVLSTDLEYGAMDRMWDFVCRRRGARYIRHRLMLPVTSTEDVIESIWSGVTKRTRVLFLSHITAVTALIMPIKELARRARDAGIWIIIDGAHAPGQIDLDLQSLGVDFYAGNCHKWMMSPKGAAFLYARPELQSLIEPLIVSWGNKSRGDSLFIQENEFQGTRDLAAYLSVPAAIAFTKEHNWPLVRKRCHQLVVSARQRIVEITGQEPLCPESDRWFRQMAAQRLPEHVDGERLHKRLFEEHSIEIPVSEINGEQFIRVSVQGYNTESDIEHFIAAFDELFHEITA
jgi:isopenicillin-N epimerase